MTQAELAATALASPLFNPSHRLRQQLGGTAGNGVPQRSGWSRVLEELLPGAAAGTRQSDRDLVPLWLLEPSDPGLCVVGRTPSPDEFLVSLRGGEGPWPQQLPLGEAHLHRLYVTSADSPAANGFYLPNGGLLIARPGERFKVSRTGMAVDDKSPPRLPTPMEVWRHAVFARTVVAPANGLASTRDDLSGAVVLLPPERRMLIKPWAPSRAMPGTSFDHRVLGFYVLLVMFTALLALVPGRLNGVVGALSLAAVAAAVAYGVRPRIFASALAQTPKERTGGPLSRIGRACTYLFAVLALPAQSVLNPHVSFLWLGLLPLGALLVAGPRRSAPWLVLLALAAGQYGVMALIE